MEQPKSELNLICPIDGAVCDRKCGYKAHCTLTRKKLEVHLPEDPADANICDGCE